MAKKKAKDPEELSKEETRWASRLSRSKAFQEKHAKGWDENKRLVFNEPDAQNQSAPPGSSSQANSVAYGWGLYEGLETAIYVKNPDTLVTARDAGKRPVAQRIQAIVNYDHELMDAKTIGNLCLLDTFICGYGAVSEVVKTHHVLNEKGEKTGEVEWQEFELRRHEPKDLLFDPSSLRLDLSDSRFLFVATYPTIEEIKSDPDYDDLPEDIDDFPESTPYTRSQGEFAGGTPNHPSIRDKGEKDPAYRQICVWECYDKVNHEVLYVADHRGHILGRRKWPVDLRFGARDLFPHTLLWMHPVPGRFYPRPEAELIAPQLKNINICERLIDEDARTKFRKWLTVAGIFTDDQKAKVTDETLANAMIYVDPTKLGEVLGITGQINPEQLDLRNLVVPIEDVAPKKDLFVRYDMLEKQIQHIVGYGPAMRGGLPSTRSAREAMMINAKQDQRLDKRKDRINDFYALLDQKHVRFLQKYLSVERYARLYPKTVGLDEWVSYGRDDIQGDFEFEVVAGTTTPKNTEVRKAAVLQMMQLIIPILQAQGQNLEPAIRIIAELNDVADEVALCFNNQQQKARELLDTSARFMKGQVPPEQLMAAIGGLLMALLSPAEFEMEKKRLEQGAPPTGGPQGAAMPGGMQGDPTAQKTTQGVL